jgi:hypothetical protein
MAGLDPAIHVWLAAKKEDVDARLKAGHDDNGCGDPWDCQPSHESAANAGFHPGMRPDFMRPDLIIAMVLAAVSAFLALAGFFVFEWSPALVGLLIGVMVAADGYFVWGIIRQNQETREGPGSASGRKSPPVP